VEAVADAQSSQGDDFRRTEPMREELPDEADEALDFDALVAVLDKLAGDDVCVDVDSGDSNAIDNP
jgi:hypothetical protein